MDRSVTGDSAARRRRSSLVKRRSSLVVGSAEACSRDTLHDSPFTDPQRKAGTLAGGVYEEPAAPGSASTIVIRLTDSLAVGRIGGQTMAAVVIVTDPGGSGVFFDLYLARQREHDWVIVDHTHLGDRIRVNKIEIERGLVGLDLTVHGPHDGICCPTERTRITMCCETSGW